MAHFGWHWNQEQQVDARAEFITRRAIKHYGGQITFEQFTQLALATFRNLAVVHGFDDQPRKFSWGGEKPEEPSFKVEFSGVTQERWAQLQLPLLPDHVLPDDPTAYGIPCDLQVRKFNDHQHTLYYKIRIDGGEWISLDSPSFALI